MRELATSTGNGSTNEEEGRLDWERQVIINNTDKCECRAIMMTVYFLCLPVLSQLFENAAVDGCRGTLDGHSRRKL